MPKATWTSLRIMAPMMTMGGFPAVTKRSLNSRPQAVFVIVTMAGIYKACFGTWGHLMTFMLKSFEPTLPPTPTG